jgi:hypothetical protein
MSLNECTCLHAGQCILVRPPEGDVTRITYADGTPVYRHPTERERHGEPNPGDFVIKGPVIDDVQQEPIIVGVPLNRTRATFLANAVSFKSDCKALDKTWRFTHPAPGEN